MKAKFFVVALLLLFLGGSTTSCARIRAKPSLAISQNFSGDATIERYRKQLEANPDDASARDKLKHLIDNQNPISDEKGKLVREILRQFARPEVISLVDKDEPGEPLIVTGTVKSVDGRPVPDVVVYVFQTDSQGHYTRANVMNEPNARLFGFLKTDKLGHYEFHTIRPGGYPGRPDRQGEQWRIPQHIHFHVMAEGFGRRQFQMVFEDDPRMTPYWHDWAKRLNFPIVTVSRDQGGVQHAVCDINPQVGLPLSP